MLKAVLLVIVVCLAVLAPRVYHLIWFMGFHTTAYNHLPGPCRVLPEIRHGAEDMELLPGGKVIIASGLRFLNAAGNPHYDNVRSHLYLFDFNLPDSPPKRMAIEGDIDLDAMNLIGLSSWIDSKSGTVYIYVVNTPGSDNFIEKFQVDLDQTKVIHLKTFGGAEEPAFTFPNDLIVVDEDKFYFTNFQYSRIALETTVALYWGSVGYFDGRHGKIVVDGLLIPNGINMSPDGRHIYVNEIGEKQMHIFKRETDNSLTLKHTEKLNSACDNIVVEKGTGDLWTGCHPIGHQTFAHMDNPDTTLATSQVLRLRVEDERVVDTTEVLVDEGKLISGSTVAVPYKDKLLVGCIASKPILCDVKYT